MNIRYDDLGKPVGRSVLGNKEEFVKHKRVKNSKSTVVKRGMSKQPSAMNQIGKNKHPSNGSESEFSTAQKSKTLGASNMYN